MFVCQWHFDVPFGKQKDVLDIMSKWNQEMFKDNATFQQTDHRTMVGHIGASASHIIDEVVVGSMADWEAGMNVVATGKYKDFSEQMAKYIVPGSQHWVVYRVAEAANGKR